MLRYTCAEKQHEPEEEYEEDFEEPCDPMRHRKNVLMVIVKIPMMTITFEPEDQLPQDDTQIIPFNPNLSTRNLIERLKELGEMCGAAGGQCKPGLVCVPDEGNLLDEMIRGQ